MKFNKVFEYLKDIRILSVILISIFIIGLIYSKCVEGMTVAESDQNAVYFRYLKWDYGDSSGLNKVELQEAQVWIGGVNIAAGLTSVDPIANVINDNYHNGPNLCDGQINFGASKMIRRHHYLILDLGQNYNYDDLQMILVIPRITTNSNDVNNDYFNQNNRTWANGRAYGDLDFSILDENSNALATYNKIGNTALHKVAHKYKFNGYDSLNETEESSWTYLYGNNTIFTYGAATNGWKIPTDNCTMTSSTIDGTIKVYDFVEKNVIDEQLNIICPERCNESCPNADLKCLQSMHPRCINCEAKMRVGDHKIVGNIGEHKHVLPVINININTDNE